MVRNRVISFPRQIVLCLSLSLIEILFVMSCQKDVGFRQKDPNALTKVQAKEYFEQTASTLKFLTAGTSPTGTKNADNSLTENMIIDWDEALEGETADSYIVEIPIRMVSPVTALMYDGLGHFNKNIRQVQMNTSLLIEKHKADGCIHHSVVTTVGSYSTTANSKYGFLCDKSSFSGYQLFSSEEGLLIASNRFDQGAVESRNLLTEANFQKVDSLGNDMYFHGISFATSLGVKTKGGGGASSGEDNKCPNCGTTMQLLYSNYIICYWCPVCDEYFNSFIDPSDVCLVCGYPENQCQCCHCSYCNMCPVYPCDCNNGEGEPENPGTCPLCGGDRCDGNCQKGEETTDPLFRIIASVHPSTPFGTIYKSPAGDYISGGVSVHIVATPNAGYHFVQWLRDTSFYSYSSSINFTASSNNYYYAVFAAD